MKPPGNTGLEASSVRMSPVAAAPPTVAVPVASPRGFAARKPAGDDSDSTLAPAPLGSLLLLFALEIFGLSKFGTSVGLRGSKMPGVPAAGRTGLAIVRYLFL